MYNSIKSGGRIRLTGQRDNHTLSNSYVRSVHMLLHNCLQQAVRGRLHGNDDCQVRAGAACPTGVEPVQGDTVREGWGEETKPKGRYLIPWAL